jgi:hypothetical protein
MKHALSLAAALLMVVGSVAQADLVAREDFDGGDVNLVSSTVPALDGGGGDWFGVGNRNAWPQGFPPGVPFGFGDDSVIDYSDPINGSLFPSDNEGVYGQNSDFDNDYFGLSDSDEFGVDQAASWTFDISGAFDLSVSVDFGGVSSSSFDGYALESDLVITAQIDGGTPQVVFDLDAIDNPGFITRPMDAGTPSGGGRLLEVTGDALVEKLLAEDGTVAGNTYLDKTPPTGPGAGELDTYRTTITGSGSTLVLSLTANMPFEAMVFDNIVIEGTLAIPTEDASWSEVKDRFRD